MWSDSGTRAISALARIADGEAKRAQGAKPAVCVGGNGGASARRGAVPP